MDVFTSIHSFNNNKILIVRQDNNVCACLIGDNETALYAEFINSFKWISDHISIYPDKDLDFVQKILNKINNPDLPDIPISFLVGTPFQRKVWSAITTIPVGQTATYSELADKIGSPGSVRAVGSACGKNPIAILVPCHRVVPKNKGIGNYRWGIKNKKFLLEREKNI